MKKRKKWHGAFFKQLCRGCYGRVAAKGFLTARAKRKGKVPLLAQWPLSAKGYCS
jgi:hypothetical protein